jgi:hypothetical protein
LSNKPERQEAALTVTDDFPQSAIDGGSMAIPFLMAFNILTTFN